MIETVIAVVLPVLTFGTLIYYSFENMQDLNIRIK